MTGARSVAAAARVRLFRPEDAPALARLFHDAINQIASLHYSPAQVAAWSPAPPDPGRFLARGADGRILLVAEDSTICSVDLTRPAPG